MLSGPGETAGANIFSSPALLVAQAHNLWYHGNVTAGYPSAAPRRLDREYIHEATQ